MQRQDLADLTAFMTVAQERSFTRASAKLGTSQSALSHTIRRLEANLGVRLLTRTTRSVSATAAGERLMATLEPAVDRIASELASLSELRDKPAGIIRITASEHAADTVLLPALEPILKTYPEIEVELSVDSSLADIVTEKFDAGVRLGEAIAKDMIAVPIGPDLRMIAVASPDYLARHPAPTTPRELADHNCINLRMLTGGGLYAWELERDGHEVKVRVEGQFTCNNVNMIIKAAVAGLGIAFVVEGRVSQRIADGQLVQIMPEWSPTFPGYHLYYPSRRQASAAFVLLVDALRYRR
ncbi:LysR family transcriptional regulator [Azorhizobium oxalatiphilum]|uniref:LysR family transcriptional regulator n=1 Tax=Azorhizobium oxalatiphilum TaxID=980631 RepID=A0A917C5T9_9HYPH|nr:LysR family transcriptional regulator [Azorhizobium oxalatiphilum]GGF71761.1 LysR family transcriptional regulator [Azorhizobium oxalatiphilum]